jgi:hypothetical protein
MANSKKNLFGAPTKVPTAKITTPATPKLTSTSALKTLSASGTSKVSAVNFGSFRSKATTSTQGSRWGSLLQAATSGQGLAGALGGGLSAFAGLGGLVGGILSLFGGGKSTPAAPVQFTLPQSQQETVSLHQQPVSVTQGSVGTSSGNAPLTVAYQPSAVPAGNAQVVQVVKQALLNSSSLNDVIADI